MVKTRTVGQPSLLRAINLRATFDLVASDGPVAAPQVVSVTGLSKPTVSEVLRDLRDRLACPVVFDNDVNLAAIGEMTRGAGRGVRDFVMISIGTGLGMAVVLDGRLHRGVSGLAGEIGYLPTGSTEPANLD